MKTKKFYSIIDGDIVKLAEKGELFLAKSLKHEIKALKYLATFDGTEKTYTICEIIVKPVKKFKILKHTNLKELKV